jgi:hypothetical protein
MGTLEVVIVEPGRVAQPFETAGGCDLSRQITASTAQARLFFFLLLLLLHYGDAIHPLNVLPI